MVLAESVCLSMGLLSGQSRLSATVGGMESIYGVFSGILSGEIIGDKAFLVLTNWEI